MVPTPWQLRSTRELAYLPNDRVVRSHRAVADRPGRRLSPRSSGDVPARRVHHADRARARLDQRQRRHLAEAARPGHTVPGMARRRRILRHPARSRPWATKGAHDRPRSTAVRPQPVRRGGRRIRPTADTDRLRHVPALPGTDAADHVGGSGPDHARRTAARRRQSPDREAENSRQRAATDAAGRPRRDTHAGIHFRKPELGRRHGRLRAAGHARFDPL